MSAAVLFAVFNAVKLKYRFLFLVTIPDMLSVFSPAPDNRLMDILPVGSGENKAVFLPDKSCTDLEACIFIRIMKYTCL